MNKPVLVVMAAGMGSRYGGMKQIDPVGPNGQVIVDYSLYDAKWESVWNTQMANSALLIPKATPHNSRLTA